MSSPKNSNDARSPLTPPDSSATPSFTPLSADEFKAGCDAFTAKMISRLQLVADEHRARLASKTNR